MPNRKRPPLEEEALLERKVARTRTLKGIGERIRARRDYLKLSQEQLALRMRSQGFDIQRSTLTHYESGSVEVPITNLLAVATALRTSVTYLVGEQEGTTENAAWLSKLRVLQSSLPVPVRATFAQHILDHAESMVTFTQDILPKEEPHA